MSTNIVYSGVTYTIPAYDDVEWGDAVSAFLIAIPAGMLTKTGGAWHLGGAGAADLDFGSAYGLVSLYLKSKTSTLAQTGFIRLARGGVGSNEKIAWRNHDNSDDSVLLPNSSNRLTYGPSAAPIELVDISTAQTQTNKTINAPDNTLTNIKDVNIAADALIAWSKIAFSGDFGSTSVITTGGVKLGTSFHVTLQADPSENYDFFFPATDGLTGQALVKASSGELEWATIPGLSLPHRNVIVGSLAGNSTNVDSSAVGDILADEDDGLTIKADVITDAMVKAAAAIGLSKLAALTANRAVATDASGFLVVSAVTDTELGYISGVTSAVQTQLGTKVAGPASAVDANIAVFDSTTGKLIKDGGAAISSLVPTSTTVNGQALSSNVTITNNTLGAQTVFSGLEDASKFTVAYNAGTRIFSLTYSAGAAYTVGGVRYTKSASTVTTTAHASTNGLWFLYFDAAGDLTVSSTPWDLLTTAPVALAYYNSSNAGGSAGALLYDERHPGVTGMDNAVHKNLHSTRGTQLVSGGVVSGFTLNTNGLANTSYAISSAVLADEDLIVAATAQLQGGANTYRVMYLTGTTAAPVWNWVDPAEGGIYSNGTNVYWNQLTGGNWQLTPLSSNGYLNYWIVAITTLNAPQFVILMGQTTYSNLTDAQAASFTTEMSNLGLLTGEAVIMYQMSYQRGSYGAPGNIRLRAATRIIESLTAVNNNNVISANGVTINTSSFTNTTSEMLSTADTTVQAVAQTANTFPSAAKVLTNKDIDGGTASDTSRLTVPKAAKATLDALTRKEGTLVYASDLDALFADDGSTLQQVGAGGAGAGRKNYIQNPSASVSETTNWTISNTTDFTVTRDTSTAIPRETTTGSAFKLVSKATNATFTSAPRMTDDADAARRLAGELAINVLTAGNWTLEVQESADGALPGTWTRISLTTDVAGVTTLPLTSGTFKFAFDTRADKRYIRVQIKSAAAADTTAYFSDILLTPDGSTVNSAVVQDDYAVTTTVSGIGTGTIDTSALKFSRIGSKLYVKGTAVFTAAGTGSSDVKVSFTGLTCTGANGTVTLLKGDGTMFTGSIARFNVTGGGLILITSDNTTVIGTEVGTSASVIAYLIFNNAVIDISEFSGGTVNVAGNDVEYASVVGWNTDTGNTTTVYGPAGSAVSGALSQLRIKTITWQQPLQTSDKIELEFSSDGISFLPVSGFRFKTSGTPIINSLDSSGGALSGVLLSQESATQTKLYFIQYASVANDDSPTKDWPTEGFWRVRKVSASSVAGFEMASATSAGLVSTQAQTIAGVKTFNDGVKLDDAAGQSTLNYYQEDDTSFASVAWKPDGPGSVIGTAFAVKITRIGRVVTLSLAGSLTADSAGNSYVLTIKTSADAAISLPTWARPSVAQEIIVYGIDTASKTLVFNVTTAGVINLYLLGGSTTFTNGTNNVGMYAGSVSYTI